jgi:integrase
MSKKNQKTTTYSLDWETVVNLESRLLRDLQLKKTTSAARNLLMVSIGTRLGLRVIDNLGLKWDDLRGLGCGD